MAKATPFLLSRQLEVFKNYFGVVWCGVWCVVWDEVFKNYLELWVVGGRKNMLTTMWITLEKCG